MFGFNTPHLAAEVFPNLKRPAPNISSKTASASGLNFREGRPAEMRQISLYETRRLIF